MHEIIEAWLDTYRAAGRSPGTIRNRRSYLTHYSAALDPLAATPDEMMAYLAGRASLSAEARKSMIVALRSFYRWAERRGLIERDMAAELPSAGVPIGKPRPVPLEILERARAIADEETVFILDLGALMGLRRDEISRVHSNDVSDFGLRVRGKGNRTRIVPIHPRLKGRLRSLRGWAFPSPVRPGHHLGPDAISWRVERVMPAGWTCHSLRHYFGTAAFAGTRNLRAVQELLGHSSVETTQRYVLVDQDALTAAVNAVA